MNNAAISSIGAQNQVPAFSSFGHTPEIESLDHIILRLIF